MFTSTSCARSWKPPGDSVVSTGAGALARTTENVSVTANAPAAHAARVSEPHGIPPHRDTGFLLQG